MRKTAKTNKTNASEPRLVIVRWHDAEADTGWDERDEKVIEKKALCDSIGWIVAKNDHTLLLAADYDETEKTTNRTLRIPIVCIERVLALDEGRAVKL